MKFNVKDRIKKPRPEGSPRVRSARRGLTVSKGAKFVLLVGDEGAVLIHLKGRTVLSRQFVPDASESSLKDLKETFDRDPRAGLVLVVDSMDQSHVQQTLPPVSSLSVNKLIKRRLDRDFGADAIKGAVPLGREKTGRRDWYFMMVAVEKSPALSQWLEFIGTLPNRLKGIHLIAVEAEMTVKALEKAMNVPKEGTGSKWKFFVSHNKVGGFRQVILKNGRIIFTRLAQPIGEFNAEVIAGNIEQEMTSTLEYLKRLSFNPAEGLDIYIIASADVKSGIDRAKFNAANFHVFTPYEVAEQLGIEGATQPTDQFGDVILSAAIGASKKHVLTLATPQASKAKNYRKILIINRATAGVIGAGLLGYSGWLGYDAISLSGEIEDIKKNTLLQRQSIENLNNEIKALNINVDNADQMIDLYKQLQLEKLSPVLFLEKLPPVTQSSIWFKAIEWKMTAAPPPSVPLEEGAIVTQPGEGMTAQLSMEFPKINDPKFFKATSKKLIEDMRSFYKGYTIEYTALPSKFSDNNQLEIDFENKDNTDEKADLIVEMTIKGPVMRPGKPK